MHRDKKVGLALAILLIGFVSSLCFPRQSEEPEEEAPLKHEAIIQKRIDEGPNRPYSPPGVDLKNVETAQDKTGAAVSEATASAVGANGWEFPKSETSDQNGSNSETVSESSNERPSNAGNRVVPIPVPAHNEDWESAGNGGVSSESVSSNGSTSEEPAFVIYKVKRGDTLSSLGSRFLGSSKRFMEIFEANRDVLKSPEAIYVGMTLKIPNQSAQSTAKKPASESKEKSSDRAAGVKGRFIPARRSPYRAGQAIRRNSASLQGKQLPIKKLSQVPPDEID
ncbi:MAG: hypothetical protein CMJ78_26595 [Planctomycetaceae bacterium]|nr:hypothetical protein [Planctomycetaceae bacterium]